MQHYSYLLLLFALFVVPRVLQRWRVPTAITNFGLGALCSLLLGYFVQDETVRLLATLGIVALFLFAGLDVSLREIRRHSTIIVQHLVTQATSLGLMAWGTSHLLDLPPRTATLVGLALVTPSTGFILDSLEALGLPDRARFWIKSKAIATEILALAALFVTLQSDSAWRLGTSSLVLAGMIGLLPAVFRVFARVVLPHAPKSEFAFLMMIALACAVITYELGVYYLVGAFVVGMAAQGLREHMPAIASEKMLVAVEAFASLFVPFYFFNAGLGLRPEDFTPSSLGLGLIFCVAGATVRIIPSWIHRRLVLGENFLTSLQVSIPMLPTLVFTLVIAGVLRDRFAIGPTLFGALVVYAILNSLVPGFVFRRSLPEIADELMEHRLRPETRN